MVRVLVYGFGFCISDLRYKLTYDLNGGSLETQNPVNYTEKTENFTLNNPTKEGYTFKGWSGTELDGDENMTVTINKGSVGNREYTANFIPNTYYIKFNANTGTGSMPNQTMTYDLTESLTKNIFTKIGYKFLGWNTLANGTGTSYLDEEEISNLTTVNNKVISLYAQWVVLPVRYAVQIYGINQDVDEEGNILGLTFGPATSADYNNSYVTHRYVANDEGIYNIEIVTTTVDENGDETQTIETLINKNSEAVTRTEEQVIQRQNINLHEMSWEEIAAVTDKTLFEDCMLCGDTKKVEMNLNSEIRTLAGCNQFGDGAGTLSGLSGVIKRDYNCWNPSQSQNEYVGSEESGVILDENELEYGSNGKNAGGYSSSHIRATLIGENEKTNRGYAGNNNLTEENCLYSCMPNDLLSVIQPKKIKYVTGRSDEEGYVLKEDIIDSIWLFSEREMYGVGNLSGGVSEGIGTNGEGYAKFSNEESKFFMENYSTTETVNRILYSEFGSITYYWLRSIVLENKTGARYIYTEGKFNSSYVYGHYGISFGFCIR